MKRLTLIILLSGIAHPLLALHSNSSGESEKMKTLFQCGVGTEKGFNGWKLEGVSHETNTYFEKDHIEFFQHNPGFYSIGFEKRIDEMVGYTDIRLTADIAAMENCSINNATAYLSKDGKHWVPLQNDVRRSADMRNEKMDFSFVRIVANITFFKEGRFRMNKTEVFGKYAPKRSPKATTERASINTSAIANGQAANQIYEEFNVFSFDKKVNVETKNKTEYEFVLSNLLGQVVLKEKAKGSNRFMTDVPNGIYIVTIIQDDKLITNKKVVL